MSITVKNGEIVEYEGIYKYAGHVNKNDDIECIPTKKEQNGRVLVEGLEAPKLGCCPHNIEWILEKELSF